jgi:hypothetical protein
MNVQKLAYVPAEFRPQWYSPRFNVGDLGASNSERSGECSLLQSASLTQIGEPEAKIPFMLRKGLKPGRFSLNLHGGRIPQLFSK